MEQTFRGKRYIVKMRSSKWKELGLCNYDDREIHLREGQPLQVLLDTAIHEGLHACLPDVSEEAVEETASCCTEFVLKLIAERLGIDLVV